MQREVGAEAASNDQIALYRYRAEQIRQTSATPCAPGGSYYARTLARRPYG